MQARRARTLLAIFKVGPAFVFRRAGEGGVLAISVQGGGAWLKRAGDHFLSLRKCKKVRPPRTHGFELLIAPLDQKIRKTRSSPRGTAQV